MSSYTMDCPPFDACGVCGTLPPGFVRLRYFFGKRMGVADFVDEQRYHAGKMRFHNQRLHGAGVLCGLAVARQSTTDVILRVAKGAAIDVCGREIVVGYDQCIDLDAWYQREIVERKATDTTWPANALDTSGKLPLVVVLRFLDCATGPEPAPRDPCSCDAAGCDFGRVREEFELDIVTANDPILATSLPLTPPRKDLDRILGGTPLVAKQLPIGSRLLARSLATAASVACADPEPDSWLVLASFTATLTTGADGVQRITDITTPIVQSTLLAETAFLQELLARQVASQLEAGALVDGPEVETLTLQRDGTTDFYWLELELTKPVLATTIPANAFTLTRLATSGTPAWTAITAATDYVAPTATAPARIRVRIDNSAGGVLVKDGLYRLALDPAKVPVAAPIVDDQLRPLRPLHPSFHFTIDKPAADLELAPAPYAR